MEPSCFRFSPSTARKDAAVGGLPPRFLTESASNRPPLIDLAYHHHHFEFQKIDGQYALDVLWQNTDPQFLKAELDTFWIRYAGEDPARYIARLGPRATHLHLKDLLPGPPVRFGEIGCGVLDFPGILRAAGEAGVRWGIVEQDSTYERRRWRQCGSAWRS